MSESVTVAECMNKRIVELRTLREQLEQAGKEKASSMIDYEKQLAVTMIKLRNGTQMSLDNERIVDPPTTIMEKVAKGICWEAKLKADTAEVRYKSLTIKMSALQAEINCFQSINRYLKENV